MGIGKQLVISLFYFMRQDMCLAQAFLKLRRMACGSPFSRYRETILHADYVIVESAYGDRIHEDRTRRREILEDVVEDTVRRAGTLLIPAFAFERRQEILHELHDLMETRKIPRLPVFLDSPLAIRAVDIFRQFEHYF